MTEPLSIAIISGVVGGVAGKFAERAWSLGAKWLSDYLHGHAPKAIEKADQNALDFLSELAQRVKKLEEEKGKYAQTIENSLDDPGFSVLLQKAILVSSETSDKQKHELLAKLIADRLTQQSESPFALSSKLACDALSALNIRQLKILGLLTNLFLLRPTNLPLAGTSKELLNAVFQDWLIKRLQVYADLTFTEMDLLHLESLSCAKWDPIVSRDFQKLFEYTKEKGFIFDYEAFFATPVGNKIVQLWKTGLEKAIPTTIGQLIGVYVSDVLTGTTTLWDGWWATP
ncbi:MAG: hypothetical protein JXB43_02630 [Dehalococcoidia bacterium]|nr:hypothetical protein [Dehalococcoidia bacterium]